LLDIKLIRDSESRKELLRKLRRRGGEFSEIDRILELDSERRTLIARVDELKAKRNSNSKQVGVLKSRKAPDEEVLPLMESVRAIGNEISLLDEKIRNIENSTSEIMLGIPNTPSDDLPDSENKVVKTVGEAVEGREAHWDISLRLGLADFERGVKLAQSRFYVLLGDGALLERALSTFMIDSAINRGYKEVMPPLLVNIASMTGTGQYPKFKDEYFACEKDGLALIPTAEVPVTNLHRDEILDKLPIRYCALTPCFRREAGAAGKDTRGVIRVHQFNKVEMVKFVEPKDSWNELESLVEDAENVLSTLKLPYRKVLLAANDVGFASAKTYDLEVWMPGSNRYVECSSCSNFTDFQARRMKIRYKFEQKSKPEFVHTLNGSGVAVGRVWAALIENNLQSDGTILIPEVLRPYMNGRERIGE